MGRTVPSFRIALEQEIASWKDYRKSLHKDSREKIDDIFNAARNYCSASSNSVRPVRFQGMLMAVAFQHEKRLENIASEIEKMRLEMDVRD